MRIIGGENFTMVIISEHVLLDDVYSDCTVDFFELHEIHSIEFNSLLNTINIQHQNVLNSNSTWIDVNKWMFLY